MDMCTNEIESNRIELLNCVIKNIIYSYNAMFITSFSQPLLRIHSFYFPGSIDVLPLELLELHTEDETKLIATFKICQSK